MTAYLKWPVAIMDYSYFFNDSSNNRREGIIREIYDLRFRIKEKTISAAEGSPNRNIIPFTNLNFSLTDGTHVSLTGDRLKRATQYLPTKGSPALLEKLADITNYIHNPPLWDERDITIGGGSQDVLNKAVDMCLEKHDPVLITEPIYSGAELMLIPYAPKVIPLPQDANGVDPEQLREALTNWRRKVDDGIETKMPKFLYLNPTGGNPTGATIPTERREEIYRICCEFNLLIFEDDPYYFIYYDGKPPVSFLNLDVEGRVIRFDSFSKILCPGMRIGWATGHKKLIRRIELHQQAEYLHVSAISQEIVNSILDHWGKDKLFLHVKSVKALFKSKRDAMLHVMEKHLKGIAEWQRPSSGMFIWTKLMHIDDVYDLVMSECVQKGVFFVPGHEFAIDFRRKSSWIRISFCNLNAADMEEAIATLATLMREHVARAKKTEGSCTVSPVSILADGASESEMSLVQAS